VTPSCGQRSTPSWRRSNKPGEVLDRGREFRVANRAQRRALRAIYRTCAHPGCDINFDRCTIHHVIAWLHHGPTDLDNLLPLCNQHHHLVHEGRWRLTLDQHRVITIHRPDGTQHFHGTTTNRTSRDASDVQGAPPCTDMFRQSASAGRTVTSPLV
jgi:hypothetical protein